MLKILQARLQQYVNRNLPDVQKKRPGKYHLICEHSISNEQIELYKKDFHDPDNHDGAITHWEPDSLECELKWALGNITMNKASGRDGIPVELFQFLKDNAVKVLYSIC